MYHCATLWSGLSMCSHLCVIFISIGLCHSVPDAQCHGTALLQTKRSSVSVYRGTADAKQDPESDDTKIIDDAQEPIAEVPTTVKDGAVIPGAIPVKRREDAFPESNVVAIPGNDTVVAPPITVSIPPLISNTASPQTLPASTATVVVPRQVANPGTTVTVPEVVTVPQANVKQAATATVPAVNRVKQVASAAVPSATQNQATGTVTGTFRLATGPSSPTAGVRVATATVPAPTMNTSVSPVNLTGRLKPLAGQAAAAQNRSQCTPVCKWSCDSPECEQVCEPICKAPTCETRCSGLDTSGCSLECDSPSCVVICPERGCPMKDGCAHCSTKCATPHCKLNCPNFQPCRNVCEEPQCHFQCRAPEHCPKPNCQLKCEYPKGCPAGHRAPLPPPATGEVTIRKFQGQDNAGATASQSDGIPALPTLAPAPQIEIGEPAAATDEASTTSAEDEPEKDEPEKAIVPARPGEKVNLLSDSDSESDESQDDDLASVLAE
eukprot:gnl/MRDRNA2_/MRDRNA2_92727_c0_seq1.p1 gnl/MRDRNA2_/MRDRNA2_92727_c0~~gnl/MRDRNA2_/MRDRNA2_92727_c0_seq1.p1  ORF type:complete len:494 (+),score=81.08 gnl/MRDRNA2_/MRDRNA2_92727_c0_seq1:106-1587(+)